MTIDRHRMGERHEEWVAQFLGGVKSRGSGNQWRAPMDGRHNRFNSHLAFAWDCKSTLGKSLSVSREMLRKAREQADGERPMIPIRFYDNERLTSWDDWILVTADDFRELRDFAEMYFVEHADD
jgi:hypothetical protein